MGIRVLGLGSRIVLGCKVDKMGKGNKKNSIAFDSAPRREADSQPISPLARPAVSRQNHTVWVFCQWQTRPKQWGDLLPRGKQWPNGNAAAGRLFGRRFKPWWGECGAADAAGSWPNRIRTADRKQCIGCVTIRLAVV